MSTWKLSRNIVPARSKENSPEPISYLYMYAFAYVVYILYILNRNLLGPLVFKKDYFFTEYLRIWKPGFDPKKSVFIMDYCVILNSKYKSKSENRLFDLEI